MTAKTAKTAKKAVATKSKTIEVQLGELFNLNPRFEQLKNTMVSPEIAFSLRKYLVEVIGANFKIIDEQRVEYVKQFNTEAEGENPRVDAEKDPKKYNDFLEALNKYFEGTVTIAISSVKMSDLEKSLKMAYRKYGNMVDVQMLIDLEKFFLAE